MWAAWALLSGRRDAVYRVVMPRVILMKRGYGRTADR